MNEQLIELYLEEHQEEIYGNPEHPEHEDYSNWTNQESMRTEKAPF